MKVAGTIDNYKIESINLAKLADEDKLISINGKIRKSINKSGGDTVIVTLYMLSQTTHITEKEILEAFKESNVLKAFESLSNDEQKDIIGEITSIKSDKKHVKVIMNYIDYLTSKQIFPP